MITCKKPAVTVGYCVVDAEGNICNGAILTRKDSREWKNELNDELGTKYPQACPHRIARVVLDK